MTVLDAALTYAARGWRVVPIRPGEKRPAIDAWTEQATTDNELVRDWWERWPNHGVGIVTGRASGLFVLDVDVGPGKWGDDTLADLEATYGPLPDTVEVLTGSGGRHLYFRYPTDVEIRNDQAGRLGLGLDIRGEGGQVLAPPTVHPCGNLYVWEASGDPDDTAIADAPGWLLELLTRPAPATAARRERVPKRTDVADSIVDWYNAHVTWPDLLEADGATYLATITERETREPYELWARPAMVNEDGYTPHTSATLYYKGSDVLKVFTSSWRGVDRRTGEIWSLDQDATYTRFGYYAARFHGGDHRAAASACAQMRRAAGEAPDLSDFVSDELLAGTQPETGDAMGDEDLHGWELVDPAVALTDGYEPPVPDVLRRGDGVHLFYRGRMNALWGESGSGKSWLALVACAQEIAAGRHVLYVDLEDHYRAVVARLLALGLPLDDIKARFHYIAPEAPYGRAAGSYLAFQVAEHDLSVVVVDSTGEAMALDGAKPNDDDDTARWHRRLPRFLARLGVCVILIDHLPKNQEGKGAIGSQRKRAAIDGHAMRVEAGIAPAKGKTGELRVLCDKDRNGNFQHGTKVADVTVSATPAGDDVTITIRAGEAVQRPTVLMERVSRYLEGLTEPASQRAVVRDVPGNTNAKKKALEVLITDGYVELKPGPRAAIGYVSTEPFRHESDADLVLPVDNSAKPNDDRDHRDHTATTPRPSVNGRGETTATTATMRLNKKTQSWSRSTHGPWSRSDSPEDHQELSTTDPEPGSRLI